MEQIAEMHKIQNRLEKYVQTYFRRNIDTEIRQEDVKMKGK